MDSGLKLHPQVLMSIADHYVRTKKQSKSDFVRVVGVILGVQSGQQMVLTHTLELTQKSSVLAMEEQEFTNDLDLFKKVYPFCELLGWYSTGSAPDHSDLEFHTSTIKRFNENPVYLLLDPTASADSKQLPISCFEFESDASSGKFIPLVFKLEADDTEQIIVDHAARVAEVRTTGSPMSAYLQAIQKAVISLRNRVKLILSFVNNCPENEIPIELMRDIQALLSRLPVMNDPVFNDDLLLELHDASLIQYLTTLTDMEAQWKNLMDSHQHSGMGSSRMFGMGGFSRSGFSHYA